VAGREPIGVLALQGDVSEHISAFHKALLELADEREVVAVTKAEQIESLSGLVIPGGESTTITRLIDKNLMREAIHSFQGGIFATCAGLVIAAREVEGENKFVPLNLLDITVNRNAFGRQRESFECDLQIRGFIETFHAVFIRAPVITHAGSEVSILAGIPQGIVAARFNKRLVLSFHPEIGTDLRFHKYFLKEVM
jgi:5'-phosphate synthase pdxT subunit